MARISKKALKKYADGTTYKRNGKVRKAQGDLAVVAKSARIV